MAAEGGAGMVGRGGGGLGVLLRPWLGHGAHTWQRVPVVRNACWQARGWSSEPPLRVEHVTQKPLFLERQLELLFFQLCKELAHFCNTATASMQRDDGQRATASMVTFCLVARRLELRLRRLQ